MKSTTQLVLGFVVMTAFVSPALAGQSRIQFSSSTVLNDEQKTLLDDELKKSCPRGFAAQDATFTEEDTTKTPAVAPNTIDTYETKVMMRFKINATTMLDYARLVFTSTLDQGTDAKVTQLMGVCN